MKLVVQRVERAKVSVDGIVHGEIKKGFLVLLGVGHGDLAENADFLVKKLCNLRVFEDENEKMNLSIKDIGGELLIISQFTLYADTKKGNRPSFVNAAPPEQAEKLYKYFMEECRKENINVEHGVFGAHMKLDFVNDGPVTIILKKENTEI